MVAPGRPRAAARSFIMVGEMPLVGRAAELAWAESLAQTGSQRGFVFRGRYGVGRTRLLRDVGLRVGGLGVRFISAPARRAPSSEVGYGWLRRAIAALLDLAPNDGTLLSGRIVAPPEALAGVRAVYADTVLPSSGETRAAVTAALRWAAEWAVSRSPGNKVLLGIDDADHLSTSDRAALAELLIGPPIAGFTVGATGMKAPRLPALVERELTGFTPAHLGELARLVGEVPAWPAQARELEPLYVDLSRRWAEGLKRIEQPASLAELVAWRMGMLVLARRQLLAAVALTGGDVAAVLAQVGMVEGDADTPLRALIDAGFLEPRGEDVVFRHGIYVEGALAGFDDARRAEMHRRAARSLASRGMYPELQAFHAIRSGADFDAFLKVDAAARLRAGRGDDEGVIAVLTEGLRGARGELERNADDDAAIDASMSFARRLGQALLHTGRADEALLVLSEVRGLRGASEGARALVLEQLSRVQAQRGRFEDAARARAEAIAIAERRGDANLVARLRGAMDPTSPEHGGRPRRRTY